MGNILPVPLSTVALLEDLGMVAMAAILGLSLSDRRCSLDAHGILTFAQG